MNLVEAFVRNPVKVAVGVLLTGLFGIVALFQMPMQLTPEVQTPTITIETLWPGASPHEVEQEIVVEQEEQLKGVEGIVKMSSESADSRGTITLEFQVGTNMDEALLKVNSRLQQVREYPPDADQPVITTANASSRPIAWFILSARRPTDGEMDEFQRRHPELGDKLEQVRTAGSLGVALLRLRLLAEEDARFGELLPPAAQDVTKLRRFAEDEIEARFERVAGISQSNVIGGLEDELQVIVDAEKLAARQVTLAEVRQVLQSQNKNTSAGDFWESKRRYVVRVPGEFQSPEQVESQLLAVRDGAPVYVRDVARVQLGYKKPDGLVRRFGESSIAINCLRETGANVLRCMDGLRETADQLNRELLNRRGLELTQAYDETEYINSSINLVRDNLFVGGALTIIVLMLFLHFGARVLVLAPLAMAAAVASTLISPWFFVLCLGLLLGASAWFARGALVASLAIPTSLVGAFLVLGALGRSLNVVSLAGLAFAVGMLVDNAVVVLENIYQWRARGHSVMDSAVRGTQEVWGAVVASTLTTVAVFVPVIFVQQEAGQLFRDIALAISAAVTFSLVISVTLIPTASARLLQGQSTGPVRQPRGLPGWVLRWASLFTEHVVKVNAWVQQRIWRKAFVSAAMVGASFALSWALWPRVEYLPTGNRNLVFGILLPPPGYNLDQLMSLGETVEKGLRPYWDVDPGSPQFDQLDAPAVEDFFFVARGRSVFIGVRAYDPLRAGELVPLVQRVAGSIPGAFAVAKQTSLFEEGLTAGRTIDIEITGPDLERLVALGGQTFGMVRELMPTAQARPVPSLDMSSPEVHVLPKLLQSADMQVNATELGFAVNALVDGAYVGDYLLGGKKIDLTVMGEAKRAERTHEIGSVPVATPLGQLVPLNALADIRLASGPEQINHRERERAITIEVSPSAETPLEDALLQIQEQIVDPLREQGVLEGGYRMRLAGTADKLRDTWEALQWNVVLALVITYLLMAALFESWLYPLVIIVTVPLGAVGGILGLQLLNLYVLQPLDVLTMLGFVILIGTVVNNPILIVHQSLNHMREDDMAPRDAILESIRSRIRPIFLTTTTTVLGLLPLVLFPGAGSELYRGLGSVVLGGLIVSTCFTLLLVPTLFSLTLELKQFVLQALAFRPRPAAQTSPAAQPTSPATVEELELA